MSIVEQRFLHHTPSAIPTTSVAAATPASMAATVPAITAAAAILASFATLASSDAAAAVVAAPANSATPITTTAFAAFAATMAARPHSTVWDADVDTVGLSLLEPECNSVAVQPLREMLGPGRMPQW